MCIDYRALDAITAKEKYPLPRNNDLLDRLKGAKVSTSLDLQSDFASPALLMRMYKRLHFGPTRGYISFWYLLLVLQILRLLFRWI